MGDVFNLKLLFSLLPSEIKLKLKDYFKNFNYKTADTFDEINTCLGLLADDIFTFHLNDRQTEDSDLIELNSLMFINLIVRVRFFSDT